MLECVYYGERLLDFEWTQFPFDYEAFRKSWYCDRLRYHLSRVKMEPSLDSFIHGISHTERVAFLSAVIAWQEQLNEEETDVLLIAGLYHDIGRTDDSHDTEHGAKSVKVLRDRKEILSPLSDNNKNLLFAIIEAHCKNPLETAKKYGYFNPDGFFAFLLCRNMLVDADVLDRIRLSNMEKLYLTTDPAKKMKAFAAEMFSKYHSITGTVFYHISENRNTQSILLHGLIQPKNGNLFFAETPEDCLQLAPCAGGFLIAKVKNERTMARIKTINPNRELLTAVYPMALFTVDLDGLTENLWRRCNARAEELFRGQGRVGIYEYLLGESLPPERIMKVEPIQLSMPILKEQKEFCESVYPGVFFTNLQ